MSDDIKRPGDLSPLLGVHLLHIGRAVGLVQVRDHRKDVVDDVVADVPPLDFDLIRGDELEQEVQLGVVEAIEQHDEVVLVRLIDLEPVDLEFLEVQGLSVLLPF